MKKDPVSNKQIKLFLTKSQKNEESITSSINNTIIDIHMQKNELRCTPNKAQKRTSQPKAIQHLEENIVKKNFKIKHQKHNSKKENFVETHFQRYFKGMKNISQVRQKSYKGYFLRKSYSRIYKEPLKLNKKKTIQTKDGVA